MPSSKKPKVIVALSGGVDSSVSAYLRDAALGTAPGAVEFVRRKHPISGLPYNASPGRVVSEQEIQDALADFPV